MATKNDEVKDEKSALERLQQSRETIKREAEILAQKIQTSKLSLTVRK